MALADLYLDEDVKDATYVVRIGGVTLPEVLGLDWRFGFETVPTATVRTPSPDAPASAVFDATVTVDAGFNGLNVRVFTGTVLDVGHDETGVNIQCQGKSRPLDNYLHKIVVTVNGTKTAKELIEDLLDDAGIVDYVVDMPAWTPGTQVEETLEFETYGEAISKVAEVDGGRWYELPSGTIRVEPRDPIPGLTKWRTYFSMRLGAGYAESYPDGVASGRPRLRQISSQQKARDVKNRAYVRGTTETQVDGEGNENSVDIEGDASATSPWVTNPDGSQAYNDLLFSNELIDTDAKAGEVAGRLVTLYNRLMTAVTADINGDPQLFLGATIGIEDPDYSGLTGRWFTEGYHTRLSGNAFATTLSVLGGTDAGGTTNISPTASYTFSIDREVMGDREWAVVGFDGCISMDWDGEIEGYEWWDNQGPMLISGSDCLMSVRVDPTTLVDPWEVTLRVTDDDGATDELTLTVDVALGGVGVIVPAIYAALESHASASLDGGMNWNDQAVSGTVISCAAKLPDGLHSGIGIYGTSAGEIWWTDDACATALTLALTGVGSPIVHMTYDKNSWFRAWAISQDGRVFLSNTSGYPDTWGEYDNLRTKLSYPSLVLNRMATPSPKGLWVFGGKGDGCPLIAFDADLVRVWGQPNIAGELGDDLPICEGQASGPLGILGWQDGIGGELGSYSGATWSTISVSGGSGYWRLKNLNGTLFRIKSSPSPWPGNLQRSGDDGVTWTTVYTQVDAQEGVTDIDRDANGVLWISVVDNYSGVTPQGSIHKSTDDGLTWQLVHSVSVMCGSIACHPTDPLQLAVIAYAGTLAGRFFYSLDGGASWSAPAAANCNYNIGSPWHNQVVWGSGNRILVTRASGTSAVHWTDNYGTAWTAGTNSAASSWMNGIVRGAVLSEFWLAWWNGVGESYLMYSSDNGLTWTSPWATASVLGFNNPNLVWRMGYSEYENALYWAETNMASAPPAILIMRYTHGDGWTDITANAAAILGSGEAFCICGLAGASAAPSDLYVAEAASREIGDLAIILHSSGHTPAVYYTDAIHGDGSRWKRCISCPGSPSGVWIAADYAIGKFCFAFEDNEVYVGDVDYLTGAMTAAEAPADLDVGDVHSHAIYCGALIYAVPSVYFVAAYATGTTDGTLYKTWDRFDTVDKLRPAPGFDAMPAGARARMVQIGAPAALPQQSILYAGESPLANGNYARHFSKLTGATWDLKANPGAAVQDPIGLVKKMGANLYRIISDPSFGSGSNFCLRPGQLRRSVDDGANWSNVGPTPVTASGDTWGVNDMIEGADGTLWLCCCPDDISNGNLAAPAVYKSVNDGVTWTKVYEDTTKDIVYWRRMISIVAHPSNANVIAAVGDRNPGVSLVWATENGGASWTLNTGSNFQSVGGKRRAVMMDNGRIVLCHSAPYYSDDYGVSWTASSGAQLSTYHYCIARGGSVLFASGGPANTPRVIRSLDYGLNWTQIFEDTDVGNSGNMSKMSGLHYDPTTDTLYVASNVDATDSPNTYMVFSLAKAAQSTIGAFKDLTYTLPDDFSGCVGLNGLAR